MRTARKLGSLLLGATIAAVVLAASAQAAATAWTIHSVATPSNFKPGDESGVAGYEVTIANNGALVADGTPITIVDTLPAGLTVKNVELHLRTGDIARDFGPEACDTDVAGAVSTVTCEITEMLSGPREPAEIYPGEEVRMVVQVAVPLTLSGPLANHAEVQGGGGEPASVTSHNRASAADVTAGFQEFHSEITDEDGKAVTGAGERPYQYTTSFAINTELSPPGAASPLAPAQGDIKDIEVALPPGLIGNPTAVKECSIRQFNSIHGFTTSELSSQFQNDCPDGSVVGMIVLQQVEGLGGIVPQPIYNLEPPKGMPAQFGFQIVGLPIYIDTSLRSDSDYGISAHLRYTSQAKRVTAASVTFWGTPADESHDRLRGHCLNAVGGYFSLGNCPAGIVDPKPFFRTPTSCASQLFTTMSFNIWSNPSLVATSTDTAPIPTNCAAPPFEPTIEARPTTNLADSPSGLHVDLHVPQPQDPEGLGAADLKNTSVTLPQGLVVNPASADGLGSCSPSQIGLLTAPGQSPPRFSKAPAQCPDNSKIGTVSIDTPLLDHPLPGAVYLASQGDNPFQSLLAIYIAVSDPESGIVVKLPGHVQANPVTGQLSTTVSASPQVPFEDFKLDFFQGARAPLRTPQICATHTTTTTLVPWSSPEGPTATPSDSFAIAASPAGVCQSSQAALPNSPSFEAGTVDPLAGAYSPFLLRLKREDGSQEINGLNVTLPPGLLAKLAGVGQCSEAQIAQAKAREVPGQGAVEKASPSCPPSSRLGTVTVGAGAGPSPYYVQGSAYLAGPYKGAPLSMLIATPAVAGPFDLGAVVVRAALHIDPETALVTVKSDPIPTILQGIPLDVRAIAVRVDRSQFTLNPTSCNPSAISAQAISAAGQAVGLSNRFQVGGCSNLAFKPRLTLALKGGTKRASHPALTATLTMPPGGTNVAAARVALPHSQFLDNSHIKTICTRVQFAANSCPRGAVYGKARAFTPLLDQPLEGPVYLRSSNNPLPDLVADLRGQLQVVLVGRIDSVNGGIRTTFATVPDAPVSRFVLSMRGGGKGLLQNSRNLCKGVNKATADFTAQNGKTVRLKPLLKAKCRKPGKGKSKK